VTLYITRLFGQEAAVLALPFAEVILLAFLLGSIPVSYLIGKIFYGVDPREFGSGATGATNTARSMGAKAGLATAVLDIFKGWTAVMIARSILVPEGASGSSAMYWAAGIALVAVIAGHAYSPWIQFKGGKGVAVAAGATIAIWWPLFFIELAIIALVTFVTGYVGLGSVIAAALLPFWIAVFPATRHIELIIMGAIAGLFVVWLHRENIQRLIAGTENKLSLGKAEKKVSNNE